MRRTIDHDMSSHANVVIHESQFPEKVRRDLLESLRLRRINHKFHYDSIKQTNKWLALHEACSPARYDADCLATYDRAFRDAAAKVRAREVHVVGLGCGGGQKDVRLLKLLKARGKTVAYSPSDVSVAMTLVARRKALKVVSSEKCFPLVCDLATTNDVAALLANHLPSRAPRLVTFFGMIPNFEPDEILPQLAKSIRRQDTLLFSANLAPGRDYAAGVKKILPQYDNELTREWLLAFLFDLGVERGGGELRFGVDRGTNSLLRVVARFSFRQRCAVQVEGEKFSFRRGDNVRLFFSYRYTPDRVRQQLLKYGLRVDDQWISKSAEEGVFLCRRQ